MKVPRALPAFLTRPAIFAQAVVIACQIAGCAPLGSDGVSVVDFGAKCEAGQTISRRSKPHGTH